MSRYIMPAHTKMNIIVGGSGISMILWKFVLREFPAIL